MTEDKKIVFSCAVRDCGKYIDLIYQNLIKFTPYFSNYKFVFAESDSTDDTVSKLIELRKKDENVKSIHLGTLQHKLYHRTDRIATARNAYLDYVQTHYSDYDYLCVFDCDDRSSEEITLDAFFSNFKYEGWDMICANQENIYYDLWALRHPYWMPVDVLKTVFMDRPSFISLGDANKMWSLSRRIHIDKNHPPIKVDSAFGGMAIIKIKSITNSRHIGHYETGEPNIEWLSFCLGLNNGNNNILINPAFINGKGDLE